MNLTLPVTEGLEIASVECWACTVPLPQPLDFGDYAVLSREYVALRLTTRDGLHADGLALSRKAPTDVAVVDIVAPQLIGRDARDPTATVAELRARSAALDLDGVVGRAFALVETCLCDLAAKRDEVPLWQALGGQPRELELLVVEGYRLPDESDSAFAERLAHRVEDGITGVKLEAASYSDPEQLQRRLEIFRSLVGDEVKVVVDLAWTVESVERGVEQTKRLQELGITWIEDPFPRDRLHLTGKLRERIPTPLGAGDEVTRPADLVDLIDAHAVDVLRVDVYAVGGLERGGAIANQAADAGLSVSLHVHPELNENCAVAWAGCNHVELFATDRGFDCAHLLLRNATWDRVQGGRLKPRHDSGSGIELDLEAIRASAYRHGEVRL